MLKDNPNTIKIRETRTLVLLLIIEIPNVFSMLMSMRVSVVAIYWSENPRDVWLLKKKHIDTLLHDILALSLTTDI